MDTLRLILLLIGLAIVGFIFLRARSQQGKKLDILRHFDKTFLSSFKSSKQPAEPLHPRRDASLDIDDLGEIDSMVAARENVPVVAKDETVGITTSDMTINRGEPMIVTLTVMAHQGKLSGPALSSAVHAQGFHFGEMMAFHRYAQPEQNRGMAVCTILNVMEPGSFPDAELEDIEVPGIILLMQLPGPVEPRAAFELVLSVGQQLALELNADLCDEHRNRLTKQGIAHLKDKIEAYRFKQKMAQIKQRH